MERFHVRTTRHRWDHVHKLHSGTDCAYSERSSIRLSRLRNSSLLSCRLEPFYAEGQRKSTSVTLHTPFGPLFAAFGESGSDSGMSRKGLSSRNCLRFASLARFQQVHRNGAIWLAITSKRSPALPMSESGHRRGLMLLARVATLFIKC